ncbi:MAG: radical SAM protein [Candidatus Omnitrophota bacterium]|jgi:hypothetical protein
MKDFRVVSRDLGFWFSRKTGLPFVAPDTIQVSLTNLCNLKCKMCSVWSNYDPREELSLADLLDIVDQAAEWGIPEINLCGGEPLLSDKCFKVIEHSKKRGLKVILTTNGTVIDENISAALVRSGVDIVCVSLDGATAVMHDSIRGIPGAYAKIIRGIELLHSVKDSGRPVTVLIFTLHNENLDEAVEFVRTAKKLRADAVYLTSLVADNIRLYSRGENNPLWISGGRLDRLDLVIDTLERMQEEYYRLDYPSFSLIKRYFRGGLRENDWICFAGFKRFVVCPDGNIQMCGEIIGNFRQCADIRKIWNSRPARKKRGLIKGCRNFCLQDCHARRESACLRQVFFG